MEWKEVRLGDIVSIKSGLAYKGAFIGKGENILLGMGCVSFKDKFLFSGARPYEADCDDKYCVEPGDIVLATRQQSDNLPILAMPAIIPSSLKAKKIIYGTNLYKVENHSEVTNDFLFWQLKMPDYIDYISSVKTGSVVRMVTKKNIEDYVFRCPPKEVRDRISKLLWGLDRKIELNNKINDDLEEMAQAIFKNCFVDFEPFKNGKFVDSELGMIPEGWKVGRADDFYQINIGKTPPRKEHKWFSNNPADKIWVSIANMGNSGIFISDSSEYLTKEAVDRHNIIMVPRNTILLSFKLTVGRVAIADKELTTNEAIARFILSDDKYMEYLYLYLKKYDYNSLGSTSSIATAVNSKTIKGMQMLQPSDKIIDAFHIQVNPIFEKIRSLTKENSRLSLLRDTLLPRLMSGELEVPE